MFLAFLGGIVQQKKGKSNEEANGAHLFQNFQFGSGS